MKDLILTEIDVETTTLNNIIEEYNIESIELLLIADRRKRVVSAGNVAEYPANPFSDWTVKATKIIRLNRWFQIGA